MSMLRPIFRRSSAITKSHNIRRLATAVDADVGRTIDQHAARDNQVRIVEVGPRDGLQNEKKTIPLATKLELIERLAKTGLQDIEAGSFVAPKWVPQVRMCTLYVLRFKS